MRAKAAYTGLIALILLSAALAAEEVRTGDIEAVFKSWDGIDSRQTPRALLSDEGHLRYIGAPKGTAFRSSASSKTGSADEIAMSFMTEHSAAFGISSSSVSLEVTGVKTSAGRSHVHMRQTYAGLPVFASGLSVQVSAEGGIKFILSDIMRNSGALDSAMLAGTPAISAEDAAKTAISHIAGLNGYEEAELRASGSTVQMIYSPEVVGNEGDPRRVWSVLVDGIFSPLISETVLVDTETKEIVLSYSLICSDKIRNIYDANSTSADPGDLVRDEGSDPSGILDADKAYNYYGDTYEFYLEEHNRDSIDGNGMVMSATVRYCDPDQACPYANAFWNGGRQRMYFGEGLAVDDIVGHELTHGVTQHTSRLIYLNESGAINESFSDIWGEFVDLWNSDWDLHGNDIPGARWLIGEDLKDSALRGPIRSMINPPYKRHYFTDAGILTTPDRYNHPGFYTGVEDNGGVHHNSGVGNKLCYLLTDGDTFNGWTIKGMGISKVADLFYEVQTNIFPNVPPDPEDPREQISLGYSPDYLDLGASLITAAQNLDYPPEEVLNVAIGCMAVEILDGGKLRFRNFRATPSQADPQNIILSWNPVILGNVVHVIITRGPDRFPENSKDGEIIFYGLGSTFPTGHYYVDTGRTAGEEYYYGLFTDLVVAPRSDGEDQKQEEVEAPLPSQLAKAVAGAQVPNYLSEVFIPFNHFDPDNPHLIDMSFTQLTFTPVGVDHATAITDGRAGHVNYNSYHAQVERNVFELPVMRRNPEDPGDFGAITINLSEDDIIDLSSYMPLRQDIPFFGSFVRPLYLASNGFITTEAFFAVDDTYNDSDPTYNIPSMLKNIPTLFSHFEVPRISPLFADLSPATGGEVWAKSMDDRIVVTFEKVPELNNWRPNTFQVELFYSGKIRFTYLELGVETAVCGISDGNGIPIYPDQSRIPGDYIEFMQDLFTDGLSHVPESDALRIEPLPVQMLVEGDTLTLQIETISSEGAPVMGVLPGPELDSVTPLDVSDINTGGSPMQFTDMGNGQAEFTWQTNNDLVPIGGLNVYSLFFTATSGSESTMQYVLIYVRDIKRLPFASNLTITPEKPKLNENIRGTYEYASPELYIEDFVIPEGDTTLYWFRNNSLVPALTNHKQVPATATSIGDLWYFSVEPVDAFGTFGEIVYSPTVRVRDEIEPDINADGTLDASDVQLATNAALGMDVSPYNADVNGDGVINAVDVQIVINKVLGQT